VVGYYSQPGGSAQISRYGNAFPFPSRRTPTQPPRSVPASTSSPAHLAGPAPASMDTE
jgi:hypothetical protein